ncbi:PIG-L family deacetylase [Lacisediminihabitans changchengi]|uniref:PIG-L family deacetylase n=1 Tax=Lacisediminihabitans changchengi TaxID=2787634 RepID=A0A934W1X4_9MICO|nr:PIG-L family deacetylase [Lacisediminihabitans changchengi]MBK4347328.1 PIG-L family deacetylase [Lacisediminihabitans changchengi]
MARDDIQAIDSERVVFVHAHPDDESITTGGAIATLVDRGATVTVVTCTRGEHGEVVPLDIRSLQGDGPALAEHRASELAAALAVLGVSDHRFLGERNARWADREPRTYLDSGMQWGRSGAMPLDVVVDDSLSAADFGEVAADIATVIDQTKATAVVSYDGTGGYGHPDHIRAAEAAQRAADVMGIPFFAVQPDGTAGELTLDVRPVFDRKRAAMAAHRSQLAIDGDNFTLSTGPARAIGVSESFSRVREAAQHPPVWKEQSLSVKIFVYVLALVVGAALGGVSTVEHQFSVMIGSWPAPVGAVVSVAVAAALFVGARLAFGERLVPLFAAIGFIGVVGLLSVPGTGGSVLVPANPAGYALTYGPAVIALVVLAWPAPGTFSRHDKLDRPAQPKGTPAS